MTEPGYTRNSLFIGGRWCSPRSAEVHHLHEAATGEVLGAAPLANSDDIDAAVEAAESSMTVAFLWSR